MLIFKKKIKIVSICILVFQSTILFSQYYTTGYFPSLKNIYMNEVMVKIEVFIEYKWI